jgi:hypothetical protein
MYLEDKTVRLQLWDTAGQVGILKKMTQNKFIDRLLLFNPKGTLPKFDSELYQRFLSGCNRL